MEQLDAPPPRSSEFPDWDRVKAHWPLAQHSTFYRHGQNLWHVQKIGSGPVALLIHGTGASTHSMAAMAEALSPSYSVWLLDLPGHAFSQTSQRFDPSLVAVSRGVCDLLKDLKVAPQLIIGHSAGAAVALEMSRYLALKPDHIVSINGALKPFEGLMGLIAPVTAKLFTFGGFAAHALARNAKNPRRVQRLLEDTGSVIPEENIGQYAYLMRHAGHIQGTLKLMASWDLTGMPELCKSLDIPTLFLVGNRDRAVSPTASRDMARLMLHASYQSLDELGHLAHEEAPEAVADTITGWATG